MGAHGKVGREIRAEPRRAGGHGRDQGRPVGHVDLPDIDSGPRPGQFRDDSRHRRPAPVQQKQVEPASGEPPGQRRSEIGPTPMIAAALTSPPPESDRPCVQKAASLRQW